MNERVAVSQVTSSQLANLVRSHVVKVTKPQSDQAITLDLNDGAGAKLDLSAVANEKMTLVHVDTKLVILFDNQSTVTAEPFFDLSGKPLAGLNVELSAGRTLNGEQFAQSVPITDDQSILPASDPSSGADFRDVSIDSLPGSMSPLALMAQEMSGIFGRGSTVTDADFGVVAHAQLFNTPASTIVGSAPGITNIPAPGGAGTQVFEAGLLGSRGQGEFDGTQAGNPGFQTTTRAGTIGFTSPGIVRETLVQEGAMVTQGQVLMKIDDTKSASELGEIRERRAANAARVARLEAEVQGRGEPEFTEELIKVAPRAVEGERNVFVARQKKLNQEVDVLQQQQIRFSDSIRLLSREIELTRNLYNQKIVPEIDMLRLERQASEIKGQLAEAQSRISGATAAFRSQAEEDLAKSRGDLAVLDETIKLARDRFRRAELRSPVNGVVNKLNVTTVGAVIQPGADVMDIVPLDDTLLVEGRIRPQDIAFIHPEQDAVVKLTAYDSSVFGSLKGKVERISADTIVNDKPDRDEKNEKFYRVMIRTDKNHLGTDEHPLPILPGMVATVEVLTGHKSVLDYMIKPARLLRDEALRER